MKMDTQRYRLRLKGDFLRLLAAAEKRNLMYFLMVLFTNWPSLRWSKMFLDHVNHMTARLLLQRTKAGDPTEPHETLFLLQTNVEAKAHYALMRNVIRVAQGGHVHPEPWDKTRGEYRPMPDGTVMLKTPKILENLSDDLRQTGFARLARELKTTHLTNLQNVRNAIAHSTFRFPDAGNRGQWIFGKYVEKKQNNLSIEVQKVPHAKFQRIVRRFFAYRLAFIDALAQYKASYGSRRFTFQSANQMKPGEILDCTFDRGTVGVTYKGTPLW